jgi:hypothetical protein
MTQIRLSATSGRGHEPSDAGPFNKVGGLFTVARMYQEPGLAWLERQAEVAEDLVAERKAAAKRHR